MSPLTNESLINHGSFVVGQVTSYEDAGDEDEERYGRVKILVKN